MKKINVDITAKNVFFRIGVCLAVLFVGFLGMMSLASMKKPPAEATPEELVLKVNALKAESEEVTVTIYGYGQVEPLNSVSISSEVSGRIVSIHSRLEPGEVIKKGDLLFAVDNSNYKAARDEAAASVSQLQNTIKRLKVQYQIDKNRLLNLERSRDLARDEFERLKTLLETHNVGTQSIVDTAERAYNGAIDRADQMQQAVTIYPLQIKETESMLSAAMARLELADVNLERCRIIAPFSGRVKMAAVEQDQYVAPGQPVVTLADDSILEIKVPLDSRDARKWLRFGGQGTEQNGAWFNLLEDARVIVRWTEEQGSNTWTGSLNRVVAFDPKTRTLTVAVRIPSGSAVSANKEELPLVEGMFCKVEIPGRTLSNVIRVPRWAVSFKNTVYISKDNRLKTVKVTVAHKEEDHVFISEGLAPDDVVITTRLVDPLEHSLLKVTLVDGEGKTS